MPTWAETWRIDMPNCFTLTKKGADKCAVLQDIDDEIRAHFGEPPDNKHWLWHWYDCIGLALAYGKTWDEQRELFEDSPELLEIIDYLEDHYVPDCWSEHK